MKLVKGSPEHTKVLELIRKGLSTSEIKKIVNAPTQAIAAIRAHNTVKTYKNWKGAKK